MERKQRRELQHRSEAHGRRRAGSAPAGARAGNDPYDTGGLSLNVTRARILHAASRLFYRRGVAAVSVDEVAACAGVTKVTVYKHYRSKDDLVASCLHALHEYFFAWFVQEVETSSEDPRERLLAVFDAYDRWFQRRSFRGCAFINYTVETTDPKRAGHRAVQAHKAQSRAYFRELAGNAGAAKPDELSGQWMLLTEGATITALVEHDTDAAKRARRAGEALLSCVHGLPPS